jgi:TonB family protein
LACGYSPRPAEIQKLLVEKEVDDDHIIVLTERDERLLLEKWTVRFSPLSFEGQYFVAEVSALWVTIHFDDREPIKWSVEETLGIVQQRPKEYPRRARLRRQQGTALLRFTVDRGGHVLAYSIDRTSGQETLDEAVVAMIERAQPLPAMPLEMPEARLELVVPVRFDLR